MSYRILGIEIERKTDILAFAAFTISVGSLIAQAINLVKGPEVTLQALTQILIKASPYPDEKIYTRISAKLVYLNTGSPGYNDITKSEKAYILLRDKTVELNGQEYVETGVKNGELIVKKISDADPVQIKSGNVVVHETYFAPWPSNGSDPSINFIEFSEFLDLIKKETELNIKVKIETVAGTIRESNCLLLVKEFIKPLEEKGWSAPVCQQAS